MATVDRPDIASRIVLLTDPRSAAVAPREPARTRVLSRPLDATKLVEIVDDARIRRVLEPA
jgi:hypothetical protein